MTRADSEAERAARQEDPSDTDIDEEAALDEVLAQQERESMILGAAAEIIEAAAPSSRKPKPPPPADDAERAQILKMLMYQVSEENLNLAHYEGDPRLRQAFVQTGLSAAAGWMRMSDLCDKLDAKKKCEQ